MEYIENTGMTAGDYRRARLKLGLSRKALARELGTALSTITKRETGAAALKPEAIAAMRHLLANPPPPAVEPPPHIKASSHQPGDRYGLFRILAVRTNKNGSRQWRPVYLRLLCECGREKFTKAGNLNPLFVCGRQCPARAALVARGSHIDGGGDIIDADGFPER